MQNNNTDPRTNGGSALKTKHPRNVIIVLLVWNPRVFNISNIPFWFYPPSQWSDSSSVESFHIPIVPISAHVLLNGCGRGRYMNSRQQQRPQKCIFSICLETRPHAANRVAVFCLYRRRISSSHLKSQLLEIQCGCNYFPVNQHDKATVRLNTTLCNSVCVKTVPTTERSVTSAFEISWILRVSSNVSETTTFPRRLFPNLCVCVFQPQKHLVALLEEIRARGAAGFLHSGAVAFSGRAAVVIKLQGSSKYMHLFIRHDAGALWR